MVDAKPVDARAEAETLAALAAELNTSLDLGHVLLRVADATRAACRADLVRIALREPDGAMVYRYLSGTRATRYEQVRLDVSQGFIGRVLETGRPFRTPDALSDPHTQPTYGRQLIEAEGVKVAMVVPIVAGGQTEGVVYVARRTPEPFNDDEERVCARLAEHAAVAVRNARLYHEARTRQREAESLAAVARTINTLDLETALQNIVDSARTLLEAEVATLFRLDDASDNLILVAGGGPGGSTLNRNLPVPRGVGLVGLAVERRAATVSADVLTDERIVYEPAMRARVEATRHRAGLAVPLSVQGRIIGALFVGALPGRTFSSEEIRLVTAFADEAAVAMANAQLYHDARTRQREAESLAAIARTINTLDLDAALRNITDSACALLQGDVAVLYRLDRTTGNMNLVAAGGALAPTLNRNVTMPPRTGLVGLAVERREAVVSADLLTDERFVQTPAMRARIEAARHRAGLAVPLVAQGRITGALFVGALPGRAFSADEVRLVTTFGDQAAVAMANAELYQEAQRVNRAKDEFLAMLGHELRNPLGAIAAAIGVLKTTGPREPPIERARAVIARQVQHLSRLVDDLLDVSRLTTGKVRLERRPADLGALVASAMTAWRAAGRFARHQVAVDASPAWIAADETRIEQVLENLVGNALKYTPAGGQITVAVRRDGDTAVLEVADTGPGMPSNLGDKVFDLFVQGDRDLDRSQGGLGIGLTLVKALVTLHGGTVEVDGAGPDRGAVFTVRLPGVPAPVSPGAAASSPTPSVPPRRVLIIEDNEDAREMLRTALTLAGHEVHDAADGRAGIEAARTVVPDVALIDVGLPGLNGYDVARRIRADACGQSMVLIAITGYGQDEDRRRALDAGFDAHLTKPVLPERLTELIAAGPGADARSSRDRRPER
jgi:signal transduction histidine kinase/CheY-like chemotaxis protein